MTITSIHPNRSVPSHPALSLGFHVLLCSAAFIPATAGAQPFILTPDRAFQASFPTLEGYEYQLFYSSDLMNWIPASERIVGCGNTEMFTFKTTNSSAFYRGQEFPP